MSTAPSAFLVVSDLDGSLLDHYNYDFEAARTALQTLKRLKIPVILASSKTFAEMSDLRNTLDNQHPFITENGAAVFIPRQYFATQPDHTQTQGDYWVHAEQPPRDYWLSVLAALQAEFPDEFISFHTAGIAGIRDMTGLSEKQAQAANTRGYSEPVLWQGRPNRLAAFVERLRTAGATVNQGGRFLSVSGHCDKGKALLWLRRCFAQNTTCSHVQDLAIGDSRNDVPMLELAQTALLIRSPVHDFPTLKRHSDVIHSSEYGPAGWAEGVTTWLHRYGLSL